MTEKPPITLLTEIHSMLSSLTTRITLLEQNMALLHDKANGRLFGDGKAQSPAPQIARASQSQIMRDLGDGQKIIGVPLAQEPAKPRQSGARVHGRVFSPEKRPIHAVSIIIKNQKSETVKQVKTDLEGCWETQLPIGKYAITYAKQMMTPIYRFVEIKPEQFDVEIL